MHLVQYLGSPVPQLGHSKAVLFVNALELLKMVFFIGAFY